MINTHLLTSSYCRVDIKSLSANLSDFIAVVTQRKDDGISRFSYDEQFFYVKISEGEIMNDVIYGCLGKQLLNNFLKTIAKCHSSSCLIDNYEKYKNVIETKFGLDKYINEFSFWGVYFTEKQISNISSIAEENLFRRECLKRNLRNETFWYLREFCFPNLKFTENVSNEIKSITGGIFKMIVSDLEKLSRFCDSIESFNWGAFKEKEGVDISDESDTVKQNEKLKKERRFNIPNVGVVESYLHIKTGEKRSYVYFDRNQKQMWVVFIGGHKPTAKY